MKRRDHKLSRNMMMCRWKSLFNRRVTPEEESSIRLSKSTQLDKRRRRREVLLNKPPDSTSRDSSSHTEYLLSLASLESPTHGSMTSNLRSSSLRTFSTTRRSTTTTLEVTVTSTFTRRC